MLLPAWMDRVYGCEQMLSISEVMCLLEISQYNGDVHESLPLARRVSVLNNMIPL